MNDVAKVSKVQELNRLLVPIENDLQQRKIDRMSAQLDDVYGQINSLADAGVIDIECSSCGDNEDSGE